MKIVGGERSQRKEREYDRSFLIFWFFLLPLFFLRFGLGKTVSDYPRKCSHSPPVFLSEYSLQDFVFSYLLCVSLLLGVACSVQLASVDTESPSQPALRSLSQVVSVAPAAGLPGGQCPSQSLSDAR